MQSAGLSSNIGTIPNPTTEKLPGKSALQTTASALQNGSITIQSVVPTQRRGDAARARRMRREEEIRREMAAHRMRKQRQADERARLLREYEQRFRRDCSTMRGLTEDIAPTTVQAHITDSNSDSDRDTDGEQPSTAGAASEARSREIVFGMLHPVHRYVLAWLGPGARMRPCANRTVCAASVRCSGCRMLPKPPVPSIQDACRPVVFRAEIMPFPRSWGRSLFPNGKVRAKLLNDVDFQYLSAPYAESQDRLKEWILSPNPDYDGSAQNINQTTIPHGFILKFTAPEPPGRYFEAGCGWHGIVGRKESESSANTPNITDPRISDRIDGNKSDVSTWYANTCWRCPDFDMLGHVNLLLEETRRYRHLVRMHPQLRFVTSAPEIWELIAYYQLIQS
jgi:hypothetical protein